MSVRVAPPVINCGSSQISWKRDPQSAVNPPAMCFCSQDTSVPRRCIGPPPPLPLPSRESYAVTVRLPRDPNAPHCLQPTSSRYLPRGRAVPSPASSGGLETVHALELPCPLCRSLSSVPAWNSSLSHALLSFSTSYRISRPTATNSTKLSFTVQPSPVLLILNPRVCVPRNLAASCVLCGGAGHQSVFLTLTRSLRAGEGI